MNILRQYFLPIGLLFFILTIIIAQQPTKIDTLKLELNQQQQLDSLGEWLKTQRQIATQQCTDLDCQVAYFDKISQQIWREPKDSLEYQAQLSFYVYQGYLLYRTGLYDQAHEVYQTIFNNQKLVSAQSPAYLHQYVHQNLGNIYTMRGEYEKAETSLNLFLDAASQPYQIGEVNNDLGKLFESKEDYLKALAYYQKGLQTPDLPEYTRGLLASNLLALQFRLEKYQTVIEEANKTIQYLMTNTNETAHWLMNTFALVGLCHAHLNDALASEKAFQKAFDFMNIAYKNNLHNRNIGKLYNRQGQAYFLLNQQEKALMAFQKGLNTVLPSFKIKNGKENPADAVLYPENTIVEALYGKTKVFAKQYANSLQTEDVKLALESYELALKVEQGLRQTYQFQPSQLISVSNMRKQSEAVIHMLYLAFQQTQDVKYAEKAFEVSEMTKASVLKERLINLSAKADYLPKDLQQKDWAFQKGLTEKYQAIAESTPADNADNYKDLAKLSADYSAFLNSLAADYPNYVNSKKAINDIKGKPILDKIVNHSKKALIEYYWTDTVQYAFVFSSKSGLTFQRLEALNDTCFTNFYKYLYQSDVPEVSFDAITQNGFKIYQHYFKQLKLNAAEIEEIIIIPDGQLSYLSFGALVKDIPDVQNGAYHQLPYLALDYRFSYNYSGSVLLELAEQEKKKSYQQQFLGFAPTFDKANFKKKNLDKTEDEISSIHQLFKKGEIHSKQQATKSLFLEKANQYGLLHLATHATAYDSTVRQGAIYFADEMLTLQEIYNLPLSAQLVVLSACESGAGTIEKGEGVMSLARAFMYQGVPSVIASLWNANDKSTNEIMLAFYQYLKDKMSKNEALQMAQKDYLENCSVKGAHPFYWAGIMMIGDAEKLENYQIFNFWWLLGIIAAVLIGFFIKKRKHQA